MGGGSDNNDNAKAFPLSLSPSVLRFVPKTACTRHILLSMNAGFSSEEHFAVAFKLQTNAPKRYNVRPRHGIVGMGDSKSVAVQLRVGAESESEIGSSSDKFLVRCAWVTRAQAASLGSGDNDGSHPLWQLLHSKSAVKRVIKCEMVDSFETSDGRPIGRPKSANAIKLETLLKEQENPEKVSGLLVKNFSRKPEDKLQQNDIQQLVKVKQSVTATVWKKIQQYAKRLYRESKKPNTPEKDDSRSASPASRLLSKPPPPPPGSPDEPAAPVAKTAPHVAKSLLATGKAELENGKFKFAVGALKRTIDETLEGSKGSDPDFQVLALRQEAFAKLGEAYEGVRDYRRSACAFISCLATQRFELDVKRAATCEKIARVHGLMEMHAKAVAWHEKQLDFSGITNAQMQSEVAALIDSYFRMGRLNEPMVTSARKVVTSIVDAAMQGDENPVVAPEEMLVACKTLSSSQGEFVWESAPKGADKRFMRRWPSSRGAVTAPQPARSQNLRTQSERPGSTVRKVRKGAHFLAPTAAWKASVTKKAVSKPRIPSPPRSIPATQQVASNANFLKPTSATVAYVQATANRDPPPPPAEPKPRSREPSPAKRAVAIHRREAVAVRKFKERCEAARARQDQISGRSRRRFKPHPRFQRRTTSVENLEEDHANRSPQHATKIASDYGASNAVLDAFEDPTPHERAEYLHEAASAALKASLALSRSTNSQRSDRAISTLTRCLRKLASESDALAFDLSTRSLACESGESDALDFAKSTLQSLLAEYDMHCERADQIAVRNAGEIGEEDSSAASNSLIESLKHAHRSWADDAHTHLQSKIANLEHELDSAKEAKESTEAMLEGAKFEIRRAHRSSASKALASQKRAALGGVRQRIRAASKSLSSLRDSVYSGFLEMADDVAHASSALAAHMVRKGPSKRLAPQEEISSSFPQQGSGATFSSSLIISPKWVYACRGGEVTMEQLLSYSSEERVKMIAAHEASLQGATGPFSFTNVFGPDDISQPELISASISEISHQALHGKAAYIFVGGGANSGAVPIFNGSNIKVGLGTVDADGVMLRVVKELIDNSEGPGAEFVVSALSFDAKEMQDLLRPASSDSNISNGIDVDSAGRAFVKDAVSVRIHTAEDFRRVKAVICSRGYRRTAVTLISIDVCTPRTRLHSPTSAKNSNPFLLGKLTFAILPEIEGSRAFDESRVPSLVPETMILEAATPASSESVHPCLMRLLEDISLRHSRNSFFSVVDALAVDESVVADTMSFGCNLLQCIRSSFEFKDLTSNQPSEWRIHHQTKKQIAMGSPSNPEVSPRSPPWK